MDGMTAKKWQSLWEKLWNHAPYLDNEQLEVLRWLVSRASEQDCQAVGKRLDALEAAAKPGTNVDWRLAQLESWHATWPLDPIMIHLADRLEKLEASAGALDPTLAAHKRCIDGLRQDVDGLMSRAAAAHAVDSVKARTDAQADPAKVAAWKAEISGKTAPMAGCRSAAQTDAEIDHIIGRLDGLEATVVAMEPERVWRSTKTLKPGWYAGTTVICATPHLIRFVGDVWPWRNIAGEPTEVVEIMTGLIEAPGGPLDKAAGIA